MKTEWTYHHHYPTRAAAKTDVFEYIEAFYNRFRLHSTLEYRNPVNFEALPIVA
ncbi:MAG: hypothetical protein B6243_12340 [Anaerolineaceae bacterium 4572_5.2]|nr:MAG: hypothetical protein B6243_12340 [Anaerolineaceae bacterium 4572_5.2]